VLAADEVSNPALLQQGDIAWRVVMSWFTDRPADSRTLADEIPFLPRREDDYTLRAAVVRTDPVTIVPNVTRQAAVRAPCG